MDLTIRKWGNSAAVVLPTAMLELLHAKIGDNLEVNFQGQAAALKVARPRYALGDLLLQCDQSAPEPGDLDAWDRIAPVGNELP